MRYTYTKNKINKKLTANNQPTYPQIREMKLHRKTLKAKWAAISTTENGVDGRSNQILWYIQMQKHLLKQIKKD